MKRAFKKIKKFLRIGKKIKQVFIEKFDYYRYRGSSFERLYTNDILRSISLKKENTSLGVNLSEKGLKSRDSIVTFLKDRGMTPESVVVDYGCGTLRIGIEIVKFLNPSFYIGLDIDYRIIKNGVDILEKKLINEKKPKLFEINEINLKIVSDMNPDILFSKGVLQHIPPENINIYLMRLSIAANGAEIYIFAKPSENTVRLSKLSWLHSTKDIEKACLQIGLSVVSNPLHNKNHYHIRTNLKNKTS